MTPQCGEVRPGATEVLDLTWNFAGSRATSASVAVVRNRALVVLLVASAGLFAQACSDAANPGTDPASAGEGDGTGLELGNPAFPGAPSARPTSPAPNGPGTPTEPAVDPTPGTPVDDAGTPGTPFNDASTTPPRDSGTVTPPPAAGPRPTRTCTATKDAEGFFQLTTQTGGYAYWVRLPPTYNANNAYPMVVGAHGCGDNAKNFATWAMAPAAQRATQGHIAVSVGAGRDGQCWTAATDEAKLLAVVDDVRTCFYAHQKKIVLAGYSSGGILAYYTGMRSARRFAGILIENSSLGSAFGGGTDAAIAAAGWKLNVAITARTGDGSFPIANIRADRTKLQGASFPLQYRELAGGHDGSSDDWSGFLLPKITTYLAP